MARHVHALATVLALAVSTARASLGAQTPEEPGKKAFDLKVDYAVRQIKGFLAKSR